MKKRELVTITRESGFYRPMYFGKTEIKNILIFNKEGVLFKTNRGWFERRNTYANGYVSNTDIYSFKISKPYGKGKRGLNGTDNFIFENSLYIHESEIGVRKVREVLALDLPTEKHYLTVADLNFIYGYCLDATEFMDNEHAECAQGYYSRSEKSELGVEIDRLTRELRELYINVTSGDVTRLLENYNISRK